MKTKIFDDLALVVGKAVTEGFYTPSQIAELDAILGTDMLGARLGLKQQSKSQRAPTAQRPVGIAAGRNHKSKR